MYFTSLSHFLKIIRSCLKYISIQIFFLRFEKMVQVADFMSYDTKFNFHQGCVICQNYFKNSIIQTDNIVIVLFLVIISSAENLNVPQILLKIFRIFYAFIKNYTSKMSQFPDFVNVRSLFTIWK